MSAPFKPTRSAIDAARPTAVRCGLTHMSVAPLGDGWSAVSWSPKSGPDPLCLPRPYELAVDHARAYVALRPLRRILDLPNGLGDLEGRDRIHVETNGDAVEVVHESASGSSFAILHSFMKGNEKRALLFALDKLPEHPNRKGASRLGRVSI